MKVKLSNGQIGEDCYYPYDWKTNYLGSDNGFRSKELDTEVHKQSTLSRLDEVSFFDIMNNKDYYEVHDGERYYNLCQRCGYVPNSKQEQYENTKPIYMDAHCKCGNPMTLANFQEEEIHKMIEDEKEREYQKVLFDRDLDW